MPKRIESLTEEQLAAIPAFREGCLKKALSTETIDREKAKAAINNLYKAGGLETPDLILFAESPMQALLMRNALKSFSNTFRDQLWPHAQDLVRSHLRDQILSQLEDQLGVRLWDRLWGHFWKQLWDRLWDRLWNQLEGQLKKQIIERFNYGVYQSLYFEGAWDYYWIAMYKYAETIGVEYDEETKKHLDAYIEYADTCGCAYLYEKIAFVCDRPEVIKFDQEGRLSNESGPALEFRDGYSLYSVRGVLVPERWVTDDLPPASELLKWKNMEQRIIGCEMAGWHNIIDELNCTVLDDDNDPMIGSLIQVNDMPDADGPEYYLKAKCGTGRTVCMNVTPAVVQDKAKTAIEANAATYQLFKNGEWSSNYTAAMYRNASAERT